MLGMGMLPGQMMQGVGGQLNDEAQKYINEAMQRQSFGQQNPWDQIARYQNVVQPISGQGNTQTSPNPYQGNMAAGALGGGLAGLGAYNQLFRNNTPHVSNPGTIWNAADTTLPISNMGGY